MPQPGAGAHRWEPGRPLVLTGFMGAGKSTIGPIVAARLGRPFHDSDDLVTAATGRTPQEWIASGDEEGFRRREEVVVGQAVAEGPVVLALGGGAITRAAVRDLLAGQALVVHLFLPWTHLLGRLDEMRPSRPLLHGLSDAEVHELYSQRIEWYGSADLEVDVAGLGPGEAAERVLRALPAPAAPAPGAGAP
ncbi:MAG: shikimate kinase [Acidimicrobiales bacterium]